MNILFSSLFATGSCKRLPKTVVIEEYYVIVLSDRSKKCGKIVSEFDKQ